MPYPSKDKPALRLVLIYLIVGSLWIVFSDRLLAVFLAGSPEQLTLYQTYKGWIFILVTSVLLWFLVRHLLQSQSGAMSRLEESELRYRNLATLAPVGIYHADAEGQIIYVNPKLTELTGLPEEENLGSEWTRAVYPEDRDYIFNTWMERVDQGSNFSAEYRFQHPDGRIIWVMERGHPEYNDQGELTGYLGTLIDITARKQEEDSRHQLEERLHLAVEAGNVGLFDWDLKTDRVYYSPVWKSQIGYSVDEISDDFSEWEQRVHPDDVERVKQNYRDYMNGLTHEHVVQFRFRHKDGSWRWILGQATKENDESGRPVRLLGSHVDITRLKEIETALRESEARLNYVLSANPTVLYRLEQKNGEVYPTWISSNVFRILGYTPEEALEYGWWYDNLHPEDRDQAMKAALEGMNRERVIDEYRFRHKEGHYVWIYDDMRILSDTETGIKEVIGSYLDVTEKRQEEEQIRLYATAFESTQDGVVVTDLENRMITVNQAFKDITGYDEEEIIGQSTELLKSDMHDEEFGRQMWQAVRENGHWQGEIWNRRRNGEVYPEWLSISTVYDNTGKPTHYVGVFSDISKLKQSEEQLEQLAHYDTLTGLPNRLLLDLRLSHAIDQNRRRGGNIGLLFLDLDDFKKVNDSLGHAVGDELLVNVARRLGGRVRSEDTLGRFGGDEFLLVLESINSPDEAGVVARDLLDSLTQPFRLSSGQELYVEGSIGISIYPDDGSTAEELLRDADTAMYRAKSQGRNQFRFFTSEMSDRILVELEIENALRRDMESGKLDLHYQPKVDLGTGLVSGVEALLRWQSDEGGFIPPIEFVPVAEKTGLIVPIGDWSIIHVCRQISGWMEENIDPVRVAINVSAHQFRGGELVDKIKHALEEYSVEPWRLEVEITESALLERPDEMMSIINQLSAMGIRITLDDFGTGYSSLGYLSRFHIHVMKIDGSFIDGIETDRNCRMIVNSIIDLAHGMDMRCIAEKVETRQQLDFLLAEGCDEIQGYYFSEALPVDGITTLLRAGKKLEK